MVKLTDKKIEWAVEQVINKCESTELCCCDIWCLKEKITAIREVL
ncbi:hypothetical protein C5S39_09835 [Candidatus Methanophagaceae archaeon]|jgi:hypothetical protein|nr:hypothetical protein C5S39_09835 [Methanophagales archaeon]